MKAIAIQNGFGINHLESIEVPKPQPATDEVLVKVQAVSLNSVDLMVVTGKLNPNLPLPFIPGADGAGTVEQVGNDVTAFKPGDAVVTTFIPKWTSGEPTQQAVDYATRQGVGSPGQLSEYKVFKVDRLTKAPANLSALEACTLPVAGLTAWNALHYAGVTAGETVLLHGTGGVSIFALQFAKALGVYVIITSSSDAKLRRAKELGADYLINYHTTPNWEETVLSFTDGVGVDAVLETVGGKNLARSPQRIANGRKHLDYGFTWRFGSDDRCAVPNGTTCDNSRHGSWQYAGFSGHESSDRAARHSSSDRSHFYFRRGKSGIYRPRARETFWQNRDPGLPARWRTKLMSQIPQPKSIESS